MNQETRKTEYRHTDQPDRDQFHQDLCDLVDEHADDPEEKYDLIKSLTEFSTNWVETYSITGAFWVTEEEVQNIDNK